MAFPGFIQIAIENTQSMYEGRLICLLLLHEHGGLIYQGRKVHTANSMRISPHLNWNPCFQAGKMPEPPPHSHYVAAISAEPVTPAVVGWAELALSFWLLALFPSDIQKFWVIQGGPTFSSHCGKPSEMARSFWCPQATVYRQ